MTLDALVLAGGDREQGLPEGVPNKAFLPVGGIPMVERVVRALRQVPAIRRIAVVGPDSAGSLRAVGNLVVPERGDLLENLRAGLQALGADGWVLVVASDLPLLTPEAIVEFLGSCERTDADFFYPIVPQGTIESRFPGLRKTFVRVAEGTFAGGGVLLLRPFVLDRVRGLVEAAVAARKNPARLATLFGTKYVVKFALGRLRIAELEERVRELTGLRGKAVLSRFPELAVDVDLGRPETLERVEAALSRRDVP